MWLREQFVRKRTNSTEESTTSEEPTGDMNAKARLKIPRILFRKRHEPIQLTTLHSPPLLDEVSMLSSSSQETTEASSSKRDHHVHFGSTLEYHQQQFPGEWYSRDEIKEMESTRWAEQHTLSRALDRWSDRSYGKVLFRMVMKFRHTPSDQESFHIEPVDFNLLERFSSRQDTLTGLERMVVEAVASETKALIGTVQQSVLMVQDMIQGDDNAAECLRVASARYSTTSSRFARLLGEVHAAKRNH